MNNKPLTKEEKLFLVKNMIFHQLATSIILAAVEWEDSGKKELNVEIIGKPQRWDDNNRDMEQNILEYKHREYKNEPIPNGWFRIAIFTPFILEKVCRLRNQQQMAEMWGELYTQVIHIITACDIIKIVIDNE